jgi:hypothetical protein
LEDVIPHHKLLFYFFQVIPHHQLKEFINVVAPSRAERGVAAILDWFRGLFV